MLCVKQLAEYESGNRGGKPVQPRRFEHIGGKIKVLGGDATIGGPPFSKLTTTKYSKLVTRARAARVHVL